MSESDMFKNDAFNVMSSFGESENINKLDDSDIYSPKDGKKKPKTNSFTVNLRSRDISNSQIDEEK